MSNTPTDVLAGQPDPSVTGVDAPTFAGQVATAANNNAAASPNPSGPGAWARGIMGAVTDVLAGVPGAAGQGARYQQQRQDQAGAIQRQQAQQQVENQQKNQQMSREDAIARATIAHENASTVYDQMQTANLSYEGKQKALANGKMGIAPYQQAGAETLQDGIDWSDAQNLIKSKKLDPTQVHAFATGEKPVLDASGNPETDASGNPVTMPTYTIVGDVPQVTLSPEQAQFISSNTSYKFPEGTKMSGIVYGTLVQQAISAATAQASIDEARAEAGLKALDTQTKTSAIKMLPDWNTVLAKTNTDPFKALQYMESDKQMAQKYPNVATLAQSLYGGPEKWQELKDKQVDEQQKAAELEQKKKEQGMDFTGDPEAHDPVAFRESLEPNARAVVDQIGQGRAPLNNPGYLLARKPEILGAVEKAYPGFDAYKVSSYQKAYQDYTSGKVSEALTSGATAFEHLAELQDLNTLGSRVPGTAANQAYQNKVDTVASELARFYGNTTEQGIKSYRDTLNATFNRGAAITTQAKSMGDRLDNLETQWKNAAPSPAYQAPMPGISQSAKSARGKLDPEYAAKVPERPKSVPTGAIWNPQAKQWQMPKTQ